MTTLWTSEAKLTQAPKSAMGSFACAAGLDSLRLVAKIQHTPAYPTSLNPQPEVGR